MVISILNNFLKKKCDILVSTTIIEVGINFPDANTIIIENSNKFGLSQLHQLRGRVGRGQVESYCIMLYKNNLSENARKRLKILKKTNNGFLIAEEDLKIRGRRLLRLPNKVELKLGFADPIHHKDLFIQAERNIKNMNKGDVKNMKI